MPEPLELKGRPASPGVAAGPLIRFGSAVGRRAPTGNAERERAALESAVASAIRQIEALMAQVEGDSAAILEFQAAMLADDELIAPATREVARGASAEAAWEAALAPQIATYAEADDDYFRARTADLTDLRDRVLRNLSGAAADAPPAGASVTGDGLTPTRFLETDWSAGGGIALAAGSAASHVAMLARSRGVPMVVGLGTFSVRIQNEISIGLPARAGTRCEIVTVSPCTVGPARRIFSPFRPVRAAVVVTVFAIVGPFGYWPSASGM